MAPLTPILEAIRQIHGELHPGACEEGAVMAMLLGAMAARTGVS